MAMKASNRQTSALNSVTFTGNDFHRVGGYGNALPGYWRAMAAATLCVSYFMGILDIVKYH